MSQDIQLKLKVVESTSQLATAALTALLPEVKAYFNKAVGSLSSQIGDIIVQKIKEQKEYVSLVGGELRIQFGLPDADSRIEQILQSIKSGQSLQLIQPAINGNKIVGKFKLEMVKSDFSDLLSVGAASLTTEKGTELPWLEWLLLQGDTVIITDYYFAIGPYATSRTGGGIMKGSTGSVWRVPPEFAGNIKNNWITRAIDSAGTEIQNLLQTSIQ